MRIKCNECGKIVSTEVIDTTIIRAWIVCPECLNKKTKFNIKKIRELYKNENITRLDRLCMYAKFFNSLIEKKKDIFEEV